MTGNECEMQSWLEHTGLPMAMIFTLFSLGVFILSVAYVIYVGR